LDFLLLPLIVCQPKAAQTAAAICLQKKSKYQIPPPHRTERFQFHL
jgi:hypothetical protein